MISPTTGKIIKDWCEDGVTLEIIRNKITSANTIEELTTIYHQYPEWYQQLTSDFMQRKQILKEEKGQSKINYSPNYVRYGNNAVTACQG